MDRVRAHPGARASRPQRAEGPRNDNACDMPEPTTSSHKAWHSRGYLPHLDEPGTVQFITFRLADAVPADVVATWKTELRLTGREDADDPRCADLRKRIERYADRGHGACWLRDDRVARTVQNALLHFDGERYRLLAWVVMPNHVHALLETLPGFPLSGVVQSWKSFAAKQANRLLGRTGPFWMEDYFDRYIRDETHLSATASYIEQNPVSAGLVHNAEDWHWGSLGARASRPLDDAGLRPAAGGTPALPGTPPEGKWPPKDAGLRPAAGGTPALPGLPPEGKWPPKDAGLRPAAGGTPALPGLPPEGKSPPTMRAFGPLRAGRPRSQGRRPRVNGRP